MGASGSTWRIRRSGTVSEEADPTFKPQPPGAPHVRLRLETPTRLPPDRLYAWWVDFREGHDDHPWLGASRTEQVGRRILARTGDTVEIEDVGRFWGVPLVEHYTAYLEPETRTVRLHGANNLARFSAFYRFEPGKVVLEVTAAPLGGLVLLGFAGTPFLKAFLKRDLEGHVRDAEEDLA